jgi:SAM-dependent methyltransferase/uncharacterized protein YbaR (Trm112 family)
MKTELARTLLCPKCYHRVETEIQSTRHGGVWQGEIVCRSCGASYPVIDGVAFLSVIDRTWKPMIQEFLARVEITEALMEDGGFEKDREQRASTEHEVTRDIMDRLFDRGVASLGITRGTRVLDVGADLCGASRYFAGLGAEVVASDVEYTHLQSVDFGEDTGGPPQGYFSRVMCDAHRLPFEDASFDIVFCRSTIHHLDGMHRAVKEMARVTVPGGRVVLVSEPVRSVLDSEAVELRVLFDHEQGLNERKEPVFYLTVPLRVFCEGVEVEYFAPTCQERTARLFRLSGRDFARTYTDGERLGFAGSFKLALATAAVNVDGTRNSVVAPKPRVVPQGEVVCDVRDIIASRIAVEAPPLEEAGGGDPATYGLKLYKQRLGHVYRGMIASGRVPHSLDVWRAGRPLLRKGFRDVERADSGPGFRRTHRRANCYVRNVPGARTILMKVRGFPASAGPAEGTVSVNGSPAGAFRVQGTGRQVISMPKPAPAAGAEVLEIEIINAATFVPDDHLHDGDTRELGLGIESIWQA